MVAELSPSKQAKDWEQRNPNGDIIFWSSPLALFISAVLLSGKSIPVPTFCLQLQRSSSPRVLPFPESRVHMG